jgi:DNA-binding CsgD family transcriptional regulator
MNTQERNRELADLYRQGMSVREIARRYKLNEHYLRTLIKPTQIKGSYDKAEVKVSAELQAWFDTIGQQREKEFCLILELAMQKEQEIADSIKIERIMAYMHFNRKQERQYFGEG